MISKYTRGMVYWIDLPKIPNEAVQSGRRPCIIVSNNVGNAFAETLIIVPCTSNLNKKESQPTHTSVQIFSGVESVVLTENVMTISKRRCDGFIGILDEVTMKSIDEALKIALNLSENNIEVHLHKGAAIEEEGSANLPVAVTESTQEYSQDKINVLRTIEEQENFIKEFDTQGVDFVVKKYNIASPSAAYQRKQYYKNKLTKKK